MKGKSSTQKLRKTGAHGCSMYLHPKGYQRKPLPRQWSTKFKSGNQEGEWKTISFNKGKKHSSKNSPTNNIIPRKKLDGPGISVKLFNANTGKYIDIQILQYKVIESTQTSVSNGRKILTRMSLDNTTIPLQNSFSLLDHEEMVLNKTNQNENSSKNIHANRHLDSQANDMVLLNFYVSTATINDNCDMQFD